MGDGRGRIRIGSPGWTIPMIRNLLLRISLKGSSEDLVYCGFYIYNLLWAGRPSVSKNGILVRRTRPGTNPSNISY
uniref:Uncharacterized protein n=1 Tax=Picea glauca TaxID=3330 RepID=A0A101LYE6_PICGL|nr:hypothetical protein ABT39_MTgene5807 [Picea glauca]